MATRKKTERNEPVLAGAGTHPVVIGLNAVIVSVADDTPYVLVVRHGEGRNADDMGDALPFGPFDPAQHRTLEIGLRSWVEEQTALQVGYVEQLYTFGDRGRHALEAPNAPRVVSVGYLALTRHAALQPETTQLNAAWCDWYRYFPWEDWRDETPPVIARVIEPALRRWARTGATQGQRTQRLDRARICFGLDGLAWDEEKVLERYELLYGARLVPEALRDERHQKSGDGSRGDNGLIPGAPMQVDHRRILATAMGRLRGKLKYRPVIFELMPETFTLFELQRTVEAITGAQLHKQNFRRLVEKGGLVEETGTVSTRAGGRPAAEFRFRRDVLRERPAPGVRVTPPRRPRGRGHE